MTAIRSAIQPAIRAAISGVYGSSSAWSPLTLFAASEVGVWYDPSDFSTMYQNSAGTTPVTAVGQPVGLILDKSDGTTLGAEMHPEPYTVSGVGWSATANSISRALTGAQSTGTLTSSPNATAGRWYRVSFTASGLSGGTSYITYGTSNVVSPASSVRIAAAGDYTFLLLATSSATRFQVVAYEGSDYAVTLTNISIKELAGNHAYQATAASRLLSATGGAVDFDGTDDSVAQSGGGGSTTGFMLVAAIKPEGGAGTVRNIWSDTGTNTGYVVRINASNQLEMAVGNGSAYTTVATTATLDVGTAYVVSAWDDGTNLNVQINSGTVASATRPTVSAGSSTATIGKSNTSAASYFNGLMYQVLQTKNDGGTDAERTEAKAYCATKGGVTL